MSESTYPAKLICGVLYRRELEMEHWIEPLQEIWGEIDHISSPCAFSEGSSYYRDEMGGEHDRRFIAFGGLVDPGELSSLKCQSVVLEKALAKKWTLGTRPVNLDPGLIMRGRMVLATTKDFAHRLYLGQGIYGEVTLLFKKSGPEALPWTYPDIKAGHYDEMLMEARRDYERDCKRLERKS